MMSTHNQYLPTNVNYNDYYRCFLEDEIVHTLLGLSINFNLVANIINAAGVFEYDGVTYYGKSEAPLLQFIPDFPDEVKALLLSFCKITYIS